MKGFTPLSTSISYEHTKTFVHTGKGYGKYPVRFSKLIGGFTLIETIVYISVSSMLLTSLMSLAFTVTESQARIRDIVRAEQTGLYILRVEENDLRKGIQTDPATFVPEITLTDVEVALTKGLQNALFEINNQPFSISLYADQ